MRNIGLGDELKEISAHLLCRPVGAGDRIAIERRQRFRDEDLLQFLGAFEFLLQSTLALGLLDRVAVDGVNDRHQKKANSRVRVKGTEIEVPARWSSG